MTEYQSPYNQMRLEVIHESVRRMKPNGHYAEFGCGPGAITPLLLTRADRVTAFDLDPNLLDTARKNNPPERTTFLCRDLNARFMPDMFHAFNGAVALEIIEHLDSPENFLQMVHDCLIPQGELLLSTPNLSSPEAMVGRIWAWREGKHYVAWNVAHEHLFSSGELVALLRRTGFVPLHILGYYYDTGALPLLRFRVRLPFDSTTFWPLNRLGFGIMVHSRRG